MDNNCDNLDVEDVDVDLELELTDTNLDLEFAFGSSIFLTLLGGGGLSRRLSIVLFKSSTLFLFSLP